MDPAQALAEVQGRVDAAAARSGRGSADVTLVAVTKYATIDAMLALARAGHQHFGENRLHDGLPKVEAARDAGLALDWHFIGHLQTNKVRQAVGNFAMFESLDSRRLGDALSRRAVFEDVAIPVLLEVNIAEDQAKFGFSRRGVMRDFADLCQLPGLDVQGLMTIGPLMDDPEAMRPHFAALRDLRAELDSMGVAPPLQHLSMGMSADFEVAIEEAATIVRVGSAIFGHRGF